ncbi:MAG: glycosyltransferase [Christensenellaceae bacterium]|jgi:glycosyltransferase involved in cell wall biosynthesis
MDEKEYKQIIEDQKRQIEILRSRVFVYEQDVAHLEKELEHALNEFGRVNAELVCVYQSKRWKLTEPLSKIKQSVKKTLPDEPAEKPDMPAVRLDPGKKNVLVIDRGVPRPDRDAGSRATLKYTQLLMELGYNVVFMGNDFLAPEPYATQLRSLGAEVLHGDYYKYQWKQWILENAHALYAAVIHRPSVAHRFLYFIKENTDAKVVYFGHDLHFLRELRAADEGGANDAAMQVQTSKAAERAVMQSADRVVMFSDAEREIIKKEFGVDSAVVPLFFYDRIPQRAASYEETSGLLFVGGFSHAPNVDGAIWFVQQIFPLIQKRIPGIKVHLVGANPPEEVLALSGENVNVTGFVTEEVLQNYYKTCRVCVVPLRYGAGVKGKTVEAMYYGLPLVSTSVGVEGMESIQKVVSPQDAPEAFANETLRLYNDEEQWKQASAGCKKYLEEYASHDIAKKKLIEIMDKVE